MARPLIAVVFPKAGLTTRHTSMTYGHIINCGFSGVWILKDEYGEALLIVHMSSQIQLPTNISNFVPPNASTLI